MFTGLLSSLMSSIIPLLIQMILAAMFGDTGTTGQ